MTKSDLFGVRGERLTTLTGKKWPAAARMLLFSMRALKMEFQSPPPFKVPCPPPTHYLTHCLAFIHFVCVLKLPVFLKFPELSDLRGLNFMGFPVSQKLKKWFNSNIRLGLH